MNVDNFRSRRRQKFLSEEYFDLNQFHLSEGIKNCNEGIKNLRTQGDLEPAGQFGVFRYALNTIKLDYTAGLAINALIPLYSNAVSSFKDWNEAYREYVQDIGKERGTELREDGPPVHFEDLYHYQMVIDITSLGVLLGDGDGLRTIAQCVERYRGTDLLFESLIERAVTDPRDNTDFFHVAPYDPLIDAYYTVETPEEASAKVKDYLDIWYKSFEGAPWHNGHLHAVEGQYMPYYGYWAFEAAAICVLYDIDDASFRDHLLYPKDLADWARANHSVDRLSPNAEAGMAGTNASLRCEANQPCPKTGYWLTPAKANSRRHFQQGQVMPDVPSDYGATIWQWDSDQSDPKRYSPVPRNSEPGYYDSCQRPRK